MDSKTSARLSRVAELSKKRKALSSGKADDTDAGSADVSAEDVERDTTKVRKNSMKLVLSQLGGLDKTAANICAACGETLSDKYVDALDKRWHKHHFVCKRCNMPFKDSEFVVHEGFAYCPEDYAALFVLKCFGCGEAIYNVSTDALDIAGVRYHTKCLLCCVCQTELPEEEFRATQKKYSLEPGTVMCDLCRELLKRSRGGDESHGHRKTVTSVLGEDDDAAIDSDDEDKPFPGAAMGMKRDSLTSAPALPIPIAVKAVPDAKAATVKAMNVLPERKRSAGPDPHRRPVSKTMTAGDSVKAKKLLGMTSEDPASSKKTFRSMLGITDDDPRLTSVLPASLKNSIIDRLKSNLPADTSAATGFKIMTSRRGSLLHEQRQKGKAVVEVVPSSPKAPAKLSEWERRKLQESYLPDCVLQRVEHDSAIDKAFCERGDCAVVLADISGFTPLTERLCKERDGPEKLSEVLNDYFNLMVDIIYMHGGDVIKFAGDALLVIWQRMDQDYRERFMTKTFTSIDHAAEVEKPISDAEKVSSVPLSPVDAKLPEEEKEGSDLEMWLVDAADKAPEASSVGEGLPCHSCNKLVTELITDFVRFLHPVLLHCISCGAVTCRDCLKHTIRDGRLMWPAVPTDSHRTVTVCKACIANKHPHVSIEDSLSTLSMRCIQACLELMRQLDGKSGLRLHMGVGSGEVLFLHVGGLKERWEFLVAGDALCQMGKAEPESHSGEVCVSPETWQLVKARCDGAAVESGSGVMIVNKVRKGVPTNCSPRRWTAWVVPPDMQPLPRDPAVEAVIMRYIPGAIRSQISKTDISTAPDLSELRRVSVLFVNLPSLGYSAKDCLFTLQKALVVMQAALYQFEGSLRQFIMDDKGTTLIGVFGLYPFAHENDALLATRCAMEMQSRLQRSDIKASIGVTTGNVFSGAVGCSKRSEYAVVGDIVNLSARLMVAGLKMTEKDICLAYFNAEAAPRGATVPQPVLCDADTFKDASVSVRFKTLIPIKVKGKADMIDIFFPLGQKEEKGDGNLQLVGQSGILIVFRETLKSMMDGDSTIMVMEGPLGAGKSRLVAELVNMGKSISTGLAAGGSESAKVSRPVAIFQGSGDPMEKSSHFFPLRPLFTQLLRSVESGTTDSGNFLGPTTAMTNVQITLDANVLRTTYLGRIISEAEYDLVPLLRDALPNLVMVDSEATKNLQGQTRVDAAITFMVDVLVKVAAAHCPVLIFENAQWFDNSTWKLLLRLAESIKGLKSDSVLLCLTMRPIIMGPENTFLASSLEKLKVLAGDTLLPVAVQPLDEADTKTLSCLCLGNAMKASNFPEIVAAAVFKRSAGNPLYVRELLTSMVEQELLVLNTDGTGVTVKGDVADGGDFPLPDSLQGVLTSRIDRLEPRCQMLVKLAAVVGEMLIDENLLRHVVSKNMEEHDAGKMDEDMATLVSRDLIVLVKPEPDRTYVFKHSVIREVAYNMMLFAKRRKCHTVIATYLEAAKDRGEMDGGSGGSKARFAYFCERYQRLAYHYSKADVQAKAVGYLEKAAQMAELGRANEDVIVYLQRAKSLGGDVRRIAQWDRRMGKAYAGLGQLTLAARHFNLVLEFHSTVSRTVSKLVAPAWVEIEMLIRSASVATFVDGKPVTVSENDVENNGLFECITTLLSKGVIDSYVGQAHEGLIAFIGAVKLALRLKGRTLDSKGALTEHGQGPSPELAKGFALLAVGVATLLGNRSLAERCTALALRLAAPLYNPSLIAELKLLMASKCLVYGEWETAETLATESLELFKSLHDSRSWEHSSAILGDTMVHLGRYPQASTILESVHASASARHDVQVQVWAWLSLGQLHWNTGLCTKFFSGCSEIQDIVTKNADRIDVGSRLTVQLCVCWVRLFQGRLVEAFLHDSLSALLKETYMDIRLTEGFVWACETLLWLLDHVHTQAMTATETSFKIAERHKKLGYGQPIELDMSPVEMCLRAWTGLDARKLDKTLSDLVSHFSKFGAIYDCAIPAYQRIKGSLLWRQGKRDAALKSWKKGRDAGIKLHMPFEVARCHFEIGRFADYDKDRRMKNLREAHRIFLDLECKHFIAAVKAEMGINSDLDAVAYFGRVLATAVGSSAAPHRMASKVRNTSHSMS